MLSRPRRLAHLVRVVVILAVGVATVALAACPPAPPRARAARVATRAELIGGPRALGEVGDWLLENDKVRFIIQDEGFSRGFGVFGGALLDADLVRPEAGRGNSAGAQGRDNFGEMFPAFFLEALNPISLPDGAGGTIPAISIDKNADGTFRDGSDGKEAVIVVRALGDDFLAITQNVNETVLGDQRQNPSFLFETRYILKPGAQHLEIETRIENRLPQRIELPKELLGNQIPAPFGDVVLFGAGNKVFLPHEAGFDLRFRLEDIYAAGNIALPAFPGLVAEFIASSSRDVSYGVMTFPPDRGGENFAFKNKAVFPDATEHSLHVPFIASAFTGVFQVVPPDEIAPNDGQFGGPDEFFVRRAFIVGDGDVASISDVVYDLLGESDALGTLNGRVQERQRPLNVEGASVIVLDDGGRKVTQARTNRDGRFDAKLRPGSYQLVVVVPNQDPSPPVRADITSGTTTFETLFVDSAAEIIVTVVEENVGAVPAKATLVGTVAPGHGGEEPKDFLFDLSLGQPFVYTDLVPDEDDDVRTRRYIESFGSAADGVVRLRARPGTYTLVASRGTEYDRFEQEVTLEAGAVRNVTATIRRAIDTEGYIGADFHLHSQFSLDSSARVDDRIANYAAEGMEYAVSTDHNFVVDYQPALQRLGLERFLNTAVGLELTTIDRGHFNGFPLQRGDGSFIDIDGDGAVDTIASRTHGSIEWALRNPQDIFDDLRALGRKDAAGVAQPIVVQVNHPRDSILGYFDQYGVNAETLEPEGIVNALLSPNAARHPEFSPQKFSFDFDAIEVFNGKRFEFLHTFVVPQDAPRLRVDGRTVVVEPVSCCEVQVGDIVRDTADRDCRDPAADECACDVDTFKFQIEQGNCDRVGDIAFPGVTEDWMKILDTLTIPGKRVIGTANSDSHEPEKEEPGSPRTYVGVPNDDPPQVLPEDITRAFRETGDVLMSNGPFIRLTTTGGNTVNGFGGIVDASGGTVVVGVHLETAGWVDMDVLRVYQDGAMVHEESIPGAGRRDFSVELPVENDGWFVVEVVGNDSLFPVVYPNEIPPLQFTDVIGALGASFGLGGNDALKPDLLFPTTPYALSNPVWLDANGDGTISPKAALPDPAQASTYVERERPHVSPGVMREVNAPWVETEAEARAAALRALPLRKRIALSRLPQWLWPSERIGDVRRSLLQFVNHAHVD